MRALVVAVALTALVAAGCTDDDAGPSPTTESTTPTSLADYTGVVLPGVGGETTTTIEEKGTARLVGTVSGPEGLLAGATVRIERLLGDREIRHDVLTGPDGRWELHDVPGGRYRVRAFLAPVYAQTKSETKFLTDGDEHAFDLKVDDQRGVVVRSDVAPDQPLIDNAVNLVVLVVQRVVGDDGVVRASPLTGTFVELTGLGRWVTRDDDTTSSTLLDDGSDDSGSLDQGATLSGEGRATFELQCAEAGAPGLALRIPVLVIPPPAAAGTGSTTTTTAPSQTTEDVPLELPACVDPAAADTTTPSTAAP